MTNFLRKREISVLRCEPVPGTGEADIYALVVGAMVGQLRERRRWTQGELATRVGLTQSTISRIERGQARPDPFEMRAIAEAFGMTTAELSAVIDRAYERAVVAAKNAVKSKGKTDWWKIALGLLGVVGVSGLAGFAVAAALAELDGAKPPAKGRKPASDG